MSSHFISKTSFLKLEQCHKAFFLYKNHPYLKDKLSVNKKLTFKRGHEVGFLARRLFPGGIDVAEASKNTEEAMALTNTLIANKTEVIYEATFLTEGVLIMVDILTLDNEKYVAYEVKSSLKVSELYLKDAYLQYYVLKKVLKNFEDLFLITLNPDYVLENELEPKKLFRKRSVKLKAEQNFLYFGHRLQEAREILEKNAIPDIAVGKHCFSPYQCDFFGECWKNTIQENSVFGLPMVSKNKLFEWHNAGIKTIEQIPTDFILKEKQIKIKNAFLSGKPFIDREKIKTFLGHLQGSVATLDMEIWAPAIPQITGTGPFSQIPFLFCLYDGKESTCFFTGHAIDERRVFAEKLIGLTEKYSAIVVYDKMLENIVIHKFTREYPDLKAGLDNLSARLHDLSDIFLGLAYYDPSFKNSFSLKTISEILLSDISYPDISSGLEAMHYFDQFRASDNDIEKEAIKAQILNYCITDTIAAFRLLEFLQKL